jgi:hypothetical protein
MRQFRLNIFLRHSFIFGLVLASAHLKSQTRRILLEEFTGAHCGNCPEGAWVLDSLLKKYPGTIGVSLHSYGFTDDMWSFEIDSVSTPYTNGSAPYMELDRLRYGASKGLYPLINRFLSWATLMHDRLLVPAELSVDLSTTWNAISREITATADINILTGLSNGEYRVTFYIVEDSVSGTGAGYDQANLYDGVAGHPFFGMGNPIVGYVHRRVVRKILPMAWGMNGIIPNAPLTGQFFTSTQYYYLPPSMDESKVSVVALVNRYSPAHDTDEVLNADESGLIQGPIANDESVLRTHLCSVFPLPSKDEVCIRPENEGEYSVTVFNDEGKISYQGEFRNTLFLNKIHTGNGVFFFSLRRENEWYGSGRIVFTE